MRPGVPCDSMRLAVFTASPHRSYRKRLRPITPAMTGPELMPMRSSRPRWPTASSDRIASRISRAMSAMARGGAGGGAGPALAPPAREGRQGGLALLGEDREKGEDDERAGNNVHGHEGGGQPFRQASPVAHELPGDPGPQEHGQERGEPTHRPPDLAEDERPKGREDAPQADAARGGGNAEDEPGEGRRQKDVKQLHGQQEVKAADPGEHDQRPGGGGKVPVRDERRDRLTEGEVEAAPHERGGQDHQGDEDEQRLAQAALLVVAGIGAGRPRARDPPPR